MTTSTSGSGTRQGTVSFPVGDNRTWQITVPGMDLTVGGYTAVWMLGSLPESALLGLPNAVLTPSSVSLVKTSGTTLSILAVGPDSQLRFTTTSADTIGFAPGQYWQQAVVIDGSGNPVTVAQGIVILTPSLNALRLNAAA